MKSADTDIAELGNRVRKEMGAFFLRRLKQDVAKDLPTKNIKRLPVEMPEVQRARYNQAIATAQQERDKFSKEQGYMLKCIMQLREISDHPYLEDDWTMYSIEDLINSSAKMKAIIPLLDDIKSKNEKVILFAERRETQNILKRLVKFRYRLDSHIINGDTPTMQNERFRNGKMSRQQAIDDFQSRNGFNVIIMSPLAAGMGLNVVGANHVVHYSRHWNPAKEEQATDRVYRIGQTKDVFVYYPMAIINGMTCFDQTLDALLAQKSQLAEATLFPTVRIEVNSEELFNKLFV
jgi:SNF2 family DNA or RNA helicase